jgi:5-methylcytosine-specific restriction endonuclease McrA
MAYLLGTKEYKRQWRLKNLDRIRAQERELYIINKNRISENRKVRRKLNPEQEKLYRKTYRLNHLEKMREYDRLWKLNRRSITPEKTREIERNNYQKNPKRFIEKNRKRKTLKRSGIVADCSQRLKLLELERFCHWCCCRLTDTNRSIDHVTPLNRGGHHIPENLVVACKKCNSSRGDKLISEWMWEAA